ncbi:hypothetical protein [Microbulbifer taiwanensis]|uniref:hypothetical protein n=1 Tax=Microbulbifer taiwanensis TaxID=986746 RepID=UPI003620D765
MLRTLVTSLLLIFSSTAVGVSRIPLQELIKHKDIQQVKISPKGTHLAVQKLYDGERILVFMSLKPLEITGILRFRGKEEVGNFYWANDERVVAEVISRKAALEAPVNYGSLFAINYDGSKGKNIFGWAAGERQTGSRIKKAESTYAHATIVDVLRDNDKEILVSTYPWARDWETHGEVYRIDIYSGVRDKVSGLPQVGGEPSPTATAICCLPMAQIAMAMSSYTAKTRWAGPGSTIHCWIARLLSGLIWKVTKPTWCWTARGRQNS